MQLVKREDRYDLYANDGQKLGSTANNTLSQSNCESIEFNFEDMNNGKVSLEDFLTKDEWEVELEHELIGECTGNNDDGYLILKRKQ